MCCVVACLTLRRLPPHQWGYDLGADISELSSCRVQLPVLLMWQPCMFKFVSVHLAWSLSTVAKLSTFAMQNWEFEMSSFVRDLLWPSPVMMLATLSEDKLFSSMSRCRSELVDFSSSHSASQSGSPIPVFHSRNCFSPLVQSALITSKAPPLPIGL